MAWYRSIRVGQKPVAIANLFMCASCHQVQTAFTADVPAREANWPRPAVIHGLDFLAEFADVTKRLNAVLARSVPLLASPRPDTFLGRRTVEPIRADSDQDFLLGDGAITEADDVNLKDNPAGR